MRRIFPVLVTLFMLGTGLLTTGAQGKDKVDTKKQPIHGTWVVTKGEAKTQLTFDGEKFTLTKSRGGKTQITTGTFKTETSKIPNTIDMTVIGGDSKEVEKYKGKTSLGLFKVDGDKLEWCANEPGRDERPADFDMKYLFLTFEREKK